MNKRLTSILIVVFILLIGLFISLSVGIIKLPFNNNTSHSIPLIERESANKKNLIKRTATSYQQLMQEGDGYFQRSNYSEALESYTQASKLEPAKLLPYEKIGNCYLSLHLLEKAYENFQYVLQKDPANTTTKLSLAKYYIQKSDFSSALDLLLTLSLQEQEVRYYIGLIRLIQGDMERGKSNLQVAIQLNKQPSISQKAQNVINNVEEFSLYTDGKNEHLQTLIARSFIQNNEYVMAIHLLKQTLKDSQTYRDAWVLLGFSYYMIQKYDLALETLNNAYTLDPEKAETQYFLGLIYSTLGIKDKALTFFILALKNKFEPRPEVQKRIADLYIIDQKYPEALDIYLDIIHEKKENNVSMFIRPIWIYIDILKEPTKALELAKKAMDLFPQSAMSFNVLGWAELANNNIPNAKKHLEKALQIDPNIQAAYLNMGDVYQKMQDIGKAKEFYEKAYFLDKSSSIGQLAATKYNTLYE